MASPRAAFCALLCVSPAFLGCTATLDFAAVSAGREHEGDAGALADGSEVTGTRDASRVAVDGGARAADAGPSLPAESGPPAADPDGGTSSEAGAASASTDAAARDPASFDCLALTPRATFCDDFEHPYLDGWSSVVVSPTTPLGGTIDLDTRGARAGTGSLLATVSAGIVSSGDYFGVLASESFDFEGVPARYSVEFDLRLEQIDPELGRQVKLFQFLFGTPEVGFNQLTLQLESHGGDASARFVENDYAPNDSSGTSKEPATRPAEFKPVPNINEWVHVRFSLEAYEPSGTDNRASLIVGQTVLYDGGLYFALRRLHPTMELGFPTVDGYFTQDAPSNAWRARYDNVMVRVEPR
jgi:hypothetical protein